MAIPPERISQATEELRGDLLESARSIYVPPISAFAGTAFWPLFEDGRLPIIATGSTPVQTGQLPTTGVILSVGAQTSNTFAVTMNAGQGAGFSPGAATLGAQNGRITAVNGDVLTVEGLSVPPVAAQTVTQTPYVGAGGRGDTGGMIRRVSATPQSTITGQATNYVALQLARYRAGALVANIGAAVVFNAATQVWPGGAYYDFSVPATQVGAGELVGVVVTGTGTGLALPAIMYTADYARLGV